MRVGLFIPPHANDFEPEVGLFTPKLAGRFGRGFGATNQNRPSGKPVNRTHGYGGRRLGPFLLLGALAGCRAGAPSLSLVGAYFPAWILCSLIGLAAGLAARAGLSATRLAEAAAYPLVLCVAVGAIFGLLAWFAFYRG